MWGGGAECVVVGTVRRYAGIERNPSRSSSAAEEPRTAPRLNGILAYDNGAACLLSPPGGLSARRTGAQPAGTQQPAGAARWRPLCLCVQRSGGLHRLVQLGSLAAGRPLRVPGGLVATPTLLIQRCAKGSAERRAMSEAVSSEYATLSSAEAGQRPDQQQRADEGGGAAQPHRRYSRLMWPVKCSAWVLGAAPDRGPSGGDDRMRMSSPALLRCAAWVAVASMAAYSVAKVVHHSVWDPYAQNLQGPALPLLDFNFRMCKKNNNAFSICVLSVSLTPKASLFQTTRNSGGTKSARRTVA